MAKTENKTENNCEATGEVKKKNTRPQAFTPLNARQAQEASVRARNLRKQVRAEMLNTVVQNYNFGDELMKALKKGDTKKVELLQTAMRLIGLHYDQSEDAVNKLQIDATTDNKTAVTGKIEFVLPEDTK